ncbi:hypothetical protein ColTof3_09682 [Colletotrichum tofieldiae]|nr:hypothetical protein ColTof3_09682 [Colletotrichum tofieldiae]
MAPATFDGSARFIFLGLARLEPRHAHPHTMLSFILDSNDLPRIVFKDKVYVQFRGCQGVPGRLPPKKS